jgi:GNAT superfamily N-acetyltransferase
MCFFYTGLFFKLKKKLPVQKKKKKKKKKKNIATCTHPANSPTQITKCIHLCNATLFQLGTLMYLPNWTVVKAVSRDTGRLMGVVSVGPTAEVPPRSAWLWPILVMAVWYSPRCVTRMLGLMNQFETAEHATIDDECVRVRDSGGPEVAPWWTLSMMAVAPEAQGAGIGSALLRMALSLVPAQTPVVLSTQKEINTRFYRKAGFEVRRDETFCAGEPGAFRTWSMVRRAPDNELIVPVLAPEDQDGDLEGEGGSED